MNEQLKNVKNELRTTSKDLIRDVTTQSYRYGVAITCNAFFGIGKTKSLLNHTFLSTKKDFNYNFSEEELREIYEKMCDINFYDDLPLINSDNEENNDYTKRAIEAVEQEKKN